MILRYNVYCTYYECVGVPEPDGEYILFIPEEVECKRVEPEHGGIAVCVKSESEQYTVDYYNVYVYTGEEWIRVGRANVWLTSIDDILTWRPAIYTIKYKGIADVSAGSRRFLLEQVATRENCKRFGCVTDFYKAWRPKEGHTLLNLIDWAITVMKFQTFGVV